MAGIEVSYVRSSSYNQFDFCPQSYLLTYVLGIPKQTNKKADQGTVVHKVMECLALLNQAYEKTGNLEIEDEALGKLSYTIDEWNLKTQLSTDEIVDINKIRGNYYVYKYKCDLPYSHSRIGVKVVSDIFNRSYNYYSSKSPVKWAPRDKLDCEQWTWIPLEYKGGMFDPRKLKIVEAEPHFNLTLERDWGSVGLKGTIDLVTCPSEGSIEIVDWKTGQRKDWGTGKIKDYDYLCSDFQLMFYYYAARQMFPQYDHFSVTIFFIRDGGPYTIHFDESTLDVVERKIKERVELIRSTELPALCDPSHKDVKCDKFCDYFKMKGADGQTNLCDFIHNEIKLIGIEEVSKKYKHEGHDVSNYKAPGGE